MDGTSDNLCGWKLCFMQVIAWFSLFLSLFPCVSLFAAIVCNNQFLLLFQACNLLYSLHFVFAVLKIAWFIKTVHTSCPFVLGLTVEGIGRHVFQLFSFKKNNWNLQVQNICLMYLIYAGCKKYIDVKVSTVSLKNKNSVLSPIMCMFFPYCFCLPTAASCYSGDSGWTQWLSFWRRSWSGGKFYLPFVP